MARILLVEDDQDISNMLRDALRLEGHAVDCAADAAQALDLSKSQSYELAIIDYVLPGIRGLDLLQLLRTANPFLRSIIISGELDHDVLDSKEIEKQLKDRLAADRYLPKPVPARDLIEIISEVLTPISGKQIDWKRVASDTTTIRRVKKKDVREMDKTLTKNRKKR